MRRIKLTVAYDGTAYKGWQLQPNGVTIEEMLNKALSDLPKEPVCVIGASRTDSGVHARGNVAVFDTESRIPGDKFCYAVNRGLPEDIRVVESEEVNFELKMKGLMKQGVNDICYVEGFERLADHKAVSGEEIEDVIHKIQKSGVCDILIIDLNSGIGSIEAAVMKISDTIVVTEKPGELCSMKMQLFLRQGIVNEYKKKMLVVHNFAESNSSYCRQNAFAEAGLIHNYGNLQMKNILHAIEKNGEMDIDRILES